MKQPIHTDQAPQAIGPYSQAMRVGQLVFLSGQIPLDPRTMEVIKGDIEQQTRRVFDNLQAVCQAAGGQLSGIAKLNVFLTDMAHFAVVNSVMAEYFQPPYPARAAVGVSQLPRAVDIEIEAVLTLDEGS